MRPSKLDKHACMLIKRKMAVVDELLYRYAMSGFPKEGINNDFTLCVSLIDLYEIIDNKVKTRDKETQDVLQKYDPGYPDNTNVKYSVGKALREERLLSDPDCPTDKE